MTQAVVEASDNQVQEEEPGKVVLKVEGLYKKFCRNLKRSMIYGMTDLAKGFLGIPPKTEELRKDEFWALQDINFELRENEILGIIGANGSGKSTLLRVLTGIFPPDKGSVWIDGKVGGIIALGAGMHPHMTGRENIYLNGTILGMTKEEIDAKFDEIVDFAELGDFLEAPLSTYSSGMKVRLGFAVAVHCQPEILLVDEVLAVGDLSFQNKSMRKLAEVRNNAKGVIFISHNMENIRQLCDKVLILDKSKCLGLFETEFGIGLYQDRMKSYESNALSKKSNRVNHIDNTILRIVSANYYDENGNIVESINYKSPIHIKIEFELFYSIEPSYVNFGISNSKNEACIWVVSNDNQYFVTDYLNPGRYKLSVKLDNHNLMPDSYEISISIRNANTNETYARYWLNRLLLKSEGNIISRAIIDKKPIFEVEPL